MSEALVNLLLAGGLEGAIDAINVASLPDSEREMLRAFARQV